VTDDLVLVDAAARRSVASELGVTLFVEAGAGSGKTTALVSRIVALIAGGRAQVTGIAAITFTEAAAAELRIRVREALENQARYAAPASDEQRRCIEALGHIDEAPISTIHGFCQRILAAHPIEAGLPPRFEVLDEVSESIEWQRRWSAEIDLLASDPAMGGLLSMAWVLDVHERRVETLARAVDEGWNPCRPESPDLRSVLSAAEQVAELGVAQLQQLLTAAVAARHICTDPEDKLLSRLEQLAEHADRLGAARSWSEALPLLVADGHLFTKQNVGQKEAWGGDADGVRLLVEEVAASYERLFQGLVDLVVGALAGYFEARSRAAASDRRSRGLLTFHDLLVLARDLLRDRTGVLVNVRRRYSHVLIDEFQDTDPLQLEIARLIGTEDGVWVAGRCFFVGDPKQSIYRFRGADLAAYEAAREEIVGPATTLLTSNFRSAPAIIDFVNSCFEDLFGERFQSLDAARTLPQGAIEASPVCVIGGQIPDKPSRREQRRIESEDCCRAIELAVRDERWAVEDASTGLSRPARLGDVAILVPRRTGLAELESALDQHHIGYRVESASLILKSQEVRDVLALARAIDEPGDHAALVATLRSPAYSIGDDELVRWVAAGGAWSIEQVPDEGAVTASPRVAAALADVARLRSSLGELGPVGTLSHAVSERRLLQVASDRPHAREAWRRIRYLIDRARVFVEASGGGLAEFADWIDGQVQGGLRSSESVVPDADEDVVRIMTVHGAKGLEFPIAILCGFGTSDEASGPPDTVLRHPDGATEVHFTQTLRTSGFESLEVEEKEREAEEATRLLYVATTRARDHLVICGHHVRNGRQTLGERLLDAAGKGPGSWRLLPSGAPAGVGGPVSPASPAARSATATATATATAGAAASITTLDEYEEWCIGRSAAIARATRRANVRATEVGTLTSPGEPPAYEPGGDEGQAEASLDDDTVLPLGLGRRRRGRAGTQIGRAVHATLQSISAADASVLGIPDAPAAEIAGATHRLQAIADAQALAERVGQRSRDVGRLARAALTSPVVRMAFASGTARRETYVSTSVEGTIVDGYVDLCFTQPDGSLVVIDYKTDSVRNSAEAREQAGRYELQAATYALALSEATGRPVAKCVLVWLSPPAQPLEHELSGPALTERIQAVREIVGALTS
jgi:ATP-dependent helicase/nuclease subunit A